MKYLVFPFGKYKGVELKKLPSTYIVLALEKFDLPYELEMELKSIMYYRLDAYMESINIISSCNNIGDAIDALSKESNLHYHE